MTNLKAPQPKFDLLIFIGRFQPLHFGHLSVIKKASELSNNVLVLVGSANAPRSEHNPFSFEERSRMITDAIVEADTNINKSIADHVLVKPLNDVLYNDQAWIAETQKIIYSTIENDLPITENIKKIGLIGHNKDNSSYYLKIFPNFSEVPVEGVKHASSGALLSSKMIRERMFQHGTNTHDDDITPFHEMSDVMPTSVRKHVARIWQTVALRELFGEFTFTNKYKKIWEATPYPVTFTTVDAIVECNGHILMVKRGEFPGKGKLALPGGFLGQDETLFDGTLRELTEETQISLPRKVLIGAVTSKQAVAFDDPHRSSRGRTITHAFHFKLNEKSLPKVKGGDDASAAMWVPIAMLTPQTCFEDHGHIIRRMLELSP